MWYDHAGHRPLLHRADQLGTVYRFPSLRQDFWVHVAVPSDGFMYNAVTTALRAANAGMRLGPQSRVARVRMLATAANGGV